MRISPGKRPNQLSLSAASQSIRPATVKSMPMLTSIFPRFSIAKPYCTDLLLHDYGLQRAGCQELGSSGTAMPRGKFMGLRSVVRLSVWRKTATMADRFHTSATLPPREGADAREQQVDLRNR